MSTKTIKYDRLFYMDNIRWLAIILVVLHHVNMTYSQEGLWYYNENASLDPLSAVVFGALVQFFQAFGMGLLFLIAGYFTHGAFDRKGFSSFVTDRMVRLGIPTLIYVLFVDTALWYYTLPLRGELRPPLWDYIASLHIPGPFWFGPMWFALALLIFSVAYAVARLFVRPPAGMKQDAQPGQNYGQEAQDDKLPGCLAVAGLVILISILAFAIRINHPIGSPMVMGFKLSYFPQYIILFIVGINAYRRNWLPRLPHSFGMAWFKAAIIGGFALWLWLIGIQVQSGGSFAILAGGLQWPSAAFAFWESFFCVGISLGLIVLFRDGYNKQGRLEKVMAENSFAVYVFHPLILVLVAVALQGLVWHPLLKFAFVGIIAVPACFLAADLVFRRSPLLKKVL